jgi:hypothetical protein
MGGRFATNLLRQVGLKSLVTNMKAEKYGSILLSVISGFSAFFQLINLVSLEFETPIPSDYLDCCPHWTRLEKSS